jgi:hypothetical protein
MVPEGEAVDQYETRTVEKETGTTERVDQSRRPERRGRTQRPNEISDAEATFLALNACPRCSYFVAGYGLIHDDLETAVSQLDNGWIQLTGDQSTRQLVASSFGVQIDSDAHFYSGCCRECRRLFTFQQSAEPDQAGIIRFRVTGSLSGGGPQTE